MQKKSVKKNRRRVNQTRRRKSIMRGGGFSNFNRLKNAIKIVVEKGVRMKNGLSKDVEPMADAATTIFYQKDPPKPFSPESTNMWIMKQDLTKLMVTHADVNANGHIYFHDELYPELKPLFLRYGLEADRSSSKKNPSRSNSKK